MSELVLPAFHLDCRDWLVTNPETLGVAEEFDGPPVLAVLSTVIIEDGEFCPARGVLTVGLLDEDVASRPLAEECVARRLTGGTLDDVEEEALRFVMPTPDGALAVVAVFEAEGPDRAAVTGRVETLMRSFRWADDTDGTDGTAGADGTDGTSGADATDATDGTAGAQGAVGMDGAGS